MRIDFDSWPENKLEKNKTKKRQIKEQLASKKQQINTIKRAAKNAKNTTTKTAAGQQKNGKKQLASSASHGVGLCPGADRVAMYNGNTGTYIFTKNQRKLITRIFFTQI